MGLNSRFGFVYLPSFWSVGFLSVVIRRSSALLVGSVWRTDDCDCDRRLFPRSLVPFPWRLQIEEEPEEEPEEAAEEEAEEEEDEIADDDDDSVRGRDANLNLVVLTLGARLQTRVVGAVRR